MCELPHELPNNLRLRTNFRKVELRHILVIVSLPKIKFGNGARKLNKISYHTFHKSPTLLDFTIISTYFERDYRCIMILLGSN